MMNSILEPEDTRTIENVEALKIYFDPFRMRIIGELVEQPRSIQDVAQRLNVPFTRLYYQFNLLEQHGIIRVVDTRRMAGAVEEKFYRISAYNFRIARHFLDTRHPHEISETLKVVLDTVFEDARAEVEKNILNGTIDLTKTSPHPDALLAQRGYFHLRADEATQFEQELAQLLQRYTRKGTQTDGQHYLITAVVAPVTLSINPNDSDDSSKP